MMQVDIKFENNLISDEQAETFAYNIYRDIAEHIKENFEDFFEWNLETISINCIMTLDELKIKEFKFNEYDLCKYNSKK